jgi:hypothetical protein
MKHHIKRIAYDIAGVTLLLISPLLGWIPGPGGVPVFLAGLGLLAVHNEWARKLLIWAKQNADKLLQNVFPIDKPNIMLIHDIIALFLLTLAISLYFILNKPLVYILPTMILAMSVFWFMYNRRRYKLLVPNKHK